jgi:enediyne biosynthesis protein E4
VLCAVTSAAQDAPRKLRPDPLPATIRFREAAAAAGIRFEHSVSPEKRYLIESMSGGVLLLDYDQDGWLDIYFTNAATVEASLRGAKVRSALYRNRGNGTFEDVTDSAGVAYPCSAMGGAVADFNNDGWPDMLITCASGMVLYQNTGQGKFVDISRQAGLTDPRWTTGSAFADYDNDGFADLMVSRYVEFDLKNLPTFGSGPTCRYRGIGVQCGPRGMKGLSDSLYHNNKDGTFTEVSKESGVQDSSAYYGLGVIWSDFNDDGRPDLFVANDSTPNYLYRNDGSGRFTDVSFIAGAAVSNDGGETASMGIAVCDYDHTGRFSINVTNFEDQGQALFRNEGELNFKEVANTARLSDTLRYLGWGIGCVDLDNDGWQDLLAVNGHVYPQVDAHEAGAKYRQGKLVFQNQHNGTFRNVSALAGAAVSVPQASRGAAFGDLDNDGRVDVVVENIDGAPTLFMNDSERKHWVTFELIGTTSNRLALGAKVRVVTGTLDQVDEVRSGGSYLSQNDLRIHFGLGDSEKVQRIEIRWPSGKKDVLQDLVADRIYLIKEGEGIVTREQTKQKLTSKPTQPRAGSQR